MEFLARVVDRFLPFDLACFGSALEKIMRSLGLNPGRDNVHMRGCRLWIFLLVGGLSLDASATLIVDFGGTDYVAADENFRSSDGDLIVGDFDGGHHRR